MKVLDRLIQRWRIGMAKPYIRPGAIVLDIGAADGALARQLPWIGKYVGVDPGAEEIREAVKTTRVLRGEFPQAVEGEGPFDVITLLAVLEHLEPETQRRIVEGSTRFLVPGGYLVITVPSAKADVVLAMLRGARLIDGMSLEQHHGFDVRTVERMFLSNPDLRLVKHRRFQAGFNNLFVFQRVEAKRCSNDDALAGEKR